jgi:hypothetical protein
VLLGIDSQLGEKFAEKLATTLLGPSLVFWGVAAVMAFVFPGDYRAKLQTILEGHSGFPLGIALIGSEHMLAGLVLALVLIAFTGILIRRLHLVTIRLMEGYWFSWFVPRNWFISYQNWMWRRASRHYQKLRTLAASNPSGFSRRKRDRLNAIEMRLHWTPTSEKQQMPTHFGNVLKACELRPSARYGLNAIVCWPHMWLVIPAHVRSEISEARATLDSHASIVTCGALLMLWLPILNWPIIPVALVLIVTAYFASISSAMTYGRLVDATFDIYRPLLYASLRMSLPNNAAEEKGHGEALTAYLFRGSDRPEIRFEPTAAIADRELH